MAAPTTAEEAATTVRAPSAPLRMTFEEYLAFDYEHALTEWVNGEVIIFMSVTEPHQRISEFLLTLIRLFVRLRALGRVIGAPYVMRAVPGGSAREPDVMFVASSNLDRLERRFLNGPADLAIEVVSDDSVARDRDEKFAEYEEAGVREYWIIDPRLKRKRADFYVLNEQGRFQPVPIPADQRYRSTVLPGFWLDVDWLWQDDPNELAALTEIVGTSSLPVPLREADGDGR